MMMGRRQRQKRQKCSEKNRGQWKNEVDTESLKDYRCLKIAKGNEVCLNRPKIKLMDEGTNDFYRKMGRGHMQT